MCVISAATTAHATGFMDDSTRSGCSLIRSRVSVFSGASSSQGALWQAQRTVLVLLISCVVLSSSLIGVSLPQAETVGPLFFKYIFSSHYAFA